MRTPESSVNLRTRIGFVGLGQMGKPMALNLVKHGVNLVVFDIEESRFAEFEHRNVCRTTNLAEVSEAEIIFLCLPSSAAVEAILLDDGGLKLRPGQTVVDTSTISYAVTVQISSALEKLGVAFLDAPVSGMEARAIDGTLSVMCGGSSETLEFVRPYLQCFSNSIVHMGPVGSGQLTKLVNQLLFDINCAALAEILPMALKMGLDPDKITEIVNSGTGRSYASEFFLPRILLGGFSAGYPMKHAYKDLISAAELGARLCIPMPVLAAATATYQMALLRDLGDCDKGAMIRVFEDLLGVQVRSRVPAQSELLQAPEGCDFDVPSKS